jgi:hypothetical protein
MAQSDSIPTQSETWASHIIVGAFFAIAIHVLLSDEKFTPGEKLVISALIGLGATYVHHTYDAPLADYIALKAA